jgi:N-acetylglucosamine kinase-like BadF-type ATPase
MRYFAAVDGGASKTLVVIVDESGQELGRGVSAGSNYQALGLEKAVTAVRKALLEAYSVANLSPATVVLDKIYLGLSGLDRADDQEIWKKKTTELDFPQARRMLFGNDGELVLAALPHSIGLSLICGTGSIAIGRDHTGKRTRAGGWGHFFGDEGSGLWFGRAVLQKAARMEDGREPETLLLDLVLREWNLASASQLIGAVYTSPSVDNARIARLSGLVFQAATAGDRTALALIEEAAEELALIVKAVYRKLEFSEPHSLSIAGGVILNHPVLLARVEALLRAQIQLDKIVQVPEPALAAAVALAQEVE